MALRDSKDTEGKGGKSKKSSLAYGVGMPSRTCGKVRKKNQWTLHVLEGDWPHRSTADKKRRSCSGPAEEHTTQDREKLGGRCAKKTFQTSFEKGGKGRLETGW